MSALKSSSAALAFVISCASPPRGVEHHRGHEETTATYNDVVEVLATELEAAYVFPDVGRRYADALRGPEFRDVVRDTPPGNLSKVLTAYLQGIHADAHLRVWGPDTEAGPTQAVAPSAPTPGGLEAAVSLTPRIAYLRFNLFPGDEDTLNRLSEFVLNNAGVEVLIIDARGHRGGGLSEMDALFAELFAEETTLVAMDTRLSVDRAGGSPITDGPTVRRVVAPDEVVRREHVAVPSAQPRLVDTKLYVLVSGYTASAAEHLALAVKRTERGIVVGEATRGGAHFGGTTDLGAGFSAFVPVGRSFNPDTGEDWEGVGVAPDTVAPAPQALVAALVDHGLSPDEAKRIDASVAYVPPESPSHRPVGAL
ncbi:MAG: S41 family peptidase [Nannocystales bacterium]